MNKIYRLRIELIGSRPTIWRKFYVPKRILLPDLHNVIQSVMGWEDAHLHQFIHNGKFYGIPDPYGELGISDHGNIKLSELLAKKNDKLIYEYDFGDGWQHRITLEAIGADRELPQLPYCEKGKMACPPEDCGGIPGYENLVRTISNPKDEEYESTMMWLGRQYDPKMFDSDMVNRKLELNFKQ